jgi:peptide-methionine (R)-S-oxide reductase
MSDENQEQIMSNNAISPKIIKTDAEWREQLTPEQYHVTRKHGTERAFTGPNWDNHEDGQYRCVCCEKPLFDSATKFDSGTGWPSFYAPKESDSVAEYIDRGFFTTRTVQIVMRIWVTCSTMVQNRPGCAIA